jgi:hypothetical protein
LITVLTGTAASAAADFLALGDYAIAYPHCSILYHGTRQSAPFALTYEIASSLVLNLQKSNEYFAVRLARCVFPRFILRVSEFKDQFQSFKQTPGNTTLKALIEGLKVKVNAASIPLLVEGLSRQEVIAALAHSVSSRIGRFKDIKKMSDTRFETEMLTAIVKYKTRIHSKHPWSLTEQGLNEITNDFNLLNDFYFGSQTRDLGTHLNLYGLLFLLDEERTEYRDLPPTEDKAVWLKDRALPRIRPLWYFVVSFCRILQTADYVFQPEDAYWLGLVDEVPGTDLINLRQMAENLTPDDAPVPS